MSSITSTHFWQDISVKTLYLKYKVW
jgi:hypothetical protein